MFTKTFLKDAAERALATFAQTLLALVGTDAVNMLSVGFVDSLKAAGVAALLSVLKSVGAFKAPNGSSASLVKLD